VDAPREAGEVIRWHPRGLNNALIFGATCHGVARLPPALSYGIGHAGTWLAHRLMRGATWALMDNLRCVRPGSSERERRTLALDTYRSYARDTIDFLRALEMRADDLCALVAEFDRNPFDQVLAAGRGALAVSAHFGNWELGGLLLRAITGYPVSFVVRAERSEAVHQMRRRLRARWAVETIEVRQHLETALRVRRLLGENRIVAMLLDRHLDRDRVAVEFFGRRAYFLRTPALMASVTGAPLVPSFVYRREDGRLTVNCAEPIHVDASGDRDEAIPRAMQTFARLLEDQIRARPQCWYQFYPFWPAQSADLHARRDGAALNESQLSRPVPESDIPNGTGPTSPSRPG
jgi:KDO2-lipid IV(A) lauroyltransferase